jgi:hypothetical protein
VVVLDREKCRPILEKRRAELRLSVDVTVRGAAEVQKGRRDLKRLIVDARQNTHRDLARAAVEVQTRAARNERVKITKDRRVVIDGKTRGTLIARADSKTAAWPLTAKAMPDTKATRAQATIVGQEGRSAPTPKRPNAAREPQVSKRDSSRLEPPSAIVRTDKNDAPPTAAVPADRGEKHAPPPGPAVKTQTDSRQAKPDISPPPENRRRLVNLPPKPTPGNAPAAVGDARRDEKPQGLNGAGARSASPRPEDKREVTDPPLKGERPVASAAKDQPGPAVGKTNIQPATGARPSPRLPDITRPDDSGRKVPAAGVREKAASVPTRSAAAPPLVIPGVPAASKTEPRVSAERPSPRERTASPMLSPPGAEKSAGKVVVPRVMERLEEAGRGKIKAKPSLRTQEDRAAVSSE